MELSNVNEKIGMKVAARRCHRMDRTPAWGVASVSFLTSQRASFRTVCFNMHFLKSKKSKGGDRDKLETCFFCLKKMVK